MSRFLGLNVTGAGLLLRFIEATALSILTFALLIYLPANLLSITSGTLLVTVSAIRSQALASLISPAQPTLGLFLVMLVFVACVFRGTRVYGPLLIQNGLAFSVYVYSLFQGGQIHLAAIGNVFGATGASLELVVDATILMVLFEVAPLLTILKGIFATRDSLTRVP
jgi:hypothetical protein